MVKCQQCQKLVFVDNCTVTNKGRVSQKVSPIYRCKMCNRVNVVLYREMSENLQLKSLHQGMSKADKTEWLALHHEEFEGCTSDIVRKSLSKFVQAKSTRTSSITGQSTFQTSYKWLDEADLKEEYKDKPDVVRETMKNAKSFVCQVTKRKMYGLPQYSSDTLEKAATQVNHEVKAVSEAQQPPTKKPRTATLTLNLF